MGIQQKFTIDEFRNYLNQADSYGDALYFLSEDSIKDANNQKQSNSNNLIEEITTELKRLIEESHKTDAYFLDLCEEAYFGEGYNEFFSKAYSDLEKGLIHTIPDKWEQTPKGVSYYSYVEIYEG